MFSHALILYQNTLLQFTNKSADTFTTIANNYKGKETVIDNNCCMFRVLYVIVRPTKIRIFQVVLKAS